jgi:hypothetical protein
VEPQAGCGSLAVRIIDRHDVDLVPQLRHSASQRSELSPDTARIRGDWRELRCKQTDAQGEASSARLAESERKLADLYRLEMGKERRSCG